MIGVSKTKNGFPAFGRRARSGSADEVYCSFASTRPSEVGGHAQDDAKVFKGVRAGEGENVVGAGEWIR